MHPCCRRSEKKALNTIHNAKGSDHPTGMEGTHMRYQLRDHERNHRIKDRVTTADEKLFVLVCLGF